MARHRPPAAPRDYHEPLWAHRSFASRPIKPPVIPPDCDPEVASRILAEHEDGEKNPAWAVWGSALFDPAFALAPANDEGVPVKGGGVVCTITHCKGMVRGVPTPEQWAKRFVHCVNAFRGIADPQTWIADAAALLAEIVRDEDYTYANRAIALLARMRKPVSETEAA